MIGRKFWPEPPRVNGSGTVIGVFQERNVYICWFEAAARGWVASCDFDQAAAKETSH